jgi:hypothetical protein
VLCKQCDRIVRRSVSFRRVYQVLAAVREQVLLAGRVQHRHHFPGVNVQAVLPFLRKTYTKGDYVVGDVVGDELGEALLLDSVFVQGGHEVGQLAGHSELQFEFTAGENQCVLKNEK